MNIALGNSAIVLGLLGSVAGIVTMVLGLQRNKPSLVKAGRRYVWVILAGAVLATVAMQRALITHDWTLRYVDNNDSTFTPLLYRITAMWSDLAGSILLWALVLAGYLALVSWHFRHRILDPLVGWAVAVGYAIAAFFFVLMLTASDPFARVSGRPPTQGPGPDPLLQNHILVAFHPPMLYLGLVGFTVPFSFAVASLITGRVGEGWLVETRRWTLFAWGFLTAGIVLGAWWSYQVVNWPGYWGWDPVENAAFLPWLTGTAYLHSVMVQERRGMLRVWNLSLLAATFSLTILGTFLTRSGVINSVHSFTNDGNVGPELLGFFGVVVAASIGLLAWRGDRLRSPGMIDSPVSREGAFLANNLLFGLFCFVVLLGTVFPLLVQALNGSDITVGSPFFDTTTMPIAICLLFLMAIAPVLPWRKASTEVLRHRLQWPLVIAAAVVVLAVAFGARGLGAVITFGLGGFAGGSALRQLVLSGRRQGLRGLVGRANGGMIVHIGVVVIAVAFAASHSFQHQTSLSLAPGQSATFQGHKVTYLGLTGKTSNIRESDFANVRVDGRLLKPAVSEYPLSNEAVPTPAIWSTPTHDLYLALSTLPSTTGGTVTLLLTIEPLIMWLWIGGATMLFGTVLAAWPGQRRRPIEPVSAAIAEVVHA
jgi:cytochrome c-type biogenesis protein CcmF